MDSPSCNVLAGLVGLLLPTFLSLQLLQLLQQHLSRGYGLYVGSAVRYGPAREGVMGSSAMRRDRRRVCLSQPRHLSHLISVLHAGCRLHHWPAHSPLHMPDNAEGKLSAEGHFTLRSSIFISIVASAAREIWNDGLHFNFTALDPAS